VPGGSAGLTLERMELPTGNVSCTIEGDSASTASQDVTASSPTSVAQVTVPVTGAVSVNAGGDITVYCDDSPGPTAEVFGDYESSSFTALLVADSSSAGAGRLRLVQARGHHANPAIGETLGVVAQPGADSRERKLDDHCEDDRFEHLMPG